jgi:hypothetical protein
MNLPGTLFDRFQDMQKTKLKPLVVKAASTQLPGTIVL